MRCTYRYAAMTKQAAQRHRWTFYEFLIIHATQNRTAMDLDTPETSGIDTSIASGLSGKNPLITDAKYRRENI